MSSLGSVRVIDVSERKPCQDMTMSSERSCSSSSENTDKLNLEEDQDWKDVETDEEKVKVVSLFGPETFDSVHSMLKHCKDVHHFDFVKVRSDLGLDFLGMIKLVNFIRSEVKRGNLTPDLSSKSVLDVDRYLQPVLEGDPLLYSFDEVVGDIGDELPSAIANGTVPFTEEDGASAVNRIIELEKELQRLQLEFSEYRETVTKALEHRWNSTDDVAKPVNGTEKSCNKKESPQDDDSHYFSSYSTNDIHEIMLKDTIRTDAYRNFIYDNKHLFKDKIVLDVGCGTGILSMLCARAGAAKVIAVDNSEIINKARENIHDNALGDTITCLRGKIEEVSLPVTQVDIIVSEWMGYCLLYEAMLDSVLWARDRYLAPDGLMIPSHITLRMAPLADPDYIADHITYWQSVYGFKMTSMLANIYDEVVVRDVKSSALAADSQPFLELPLHSIQKEDLTFSRRPVTFQLKEDIVSLDGFVIWFDTFLLPSRERKAPLNEKAEAWKYSCPANDGLAFTTGPGGPHTHWQQGVLLIDHGRRGAAALKKGQIIRADVGYKKRKDNQRELDITIRWEIKGSRVKAKQLWFMR